MKKFSTLSKREQRIFVVALLILLSVGGWYVYDMVARKWDELNIDIASKTQTLLASQKNYLEEEQTRREYDEVVNSLRIEGTDSDKQIAIMKELNDLMLEANIISKAAKPLNSLEEEKFQIFPFSYDDTETNMNDLVLFLRLLEKRSKVSEIQSIEIKQPQPLLYKKGEQRFKTNFRISRLVYRR